MTEKEILVKARELIEKPEAWTQHFSARDVAGSPVSPRWKDAVSFCPIGAIDKASGGSFHSILYNRTRMYLSAHMDYGISRWNDAHYRTHEEVLAAFDRAIEAA